MRTSIIKKKILWLTIITLIAIMITFLFVAGCTSEKKQPLELTSVNVQLKWVHQAQFAGNYVAKEKGFYQEQGIQINNSMPFDYVNWPIDRVENKEVEFGITGGDELILAKAEGRAEHVKAVAVIYRINPVCLYSLKESGILTPKDLIGKTVGIERAPDGKDLNVGILYRAMLKKIGIDRNKIKEVTIGYDATELLLGKVDVSSGYIINEPQMVITAGKEINIILPAEYGTNMYADVLIAHEDLIENNPQLVDGFVKATIKGWHYAIENEEEAVDIILHYATDGSRDHEKYMLEQSIPLIVGEGNEIGKMDGEEWKMGIEILTQTGLLHKEIDLEDLYTSQFTSENFP